MPFSVFRKKWVVSGKLNVMDTEDHAVTLGEPINKSDIRGESKTKKKKPEKLRKEGR